MADPDEAEALSRRCRRSGEPVAAATVVDGAAGLIGRLMTVTGDGFAGSVAPGAVDEVIVREARRSLEDGEARILAFAGRPSTRVFVEPVAHADLVIRAEDEAATGTPTADVIDLATGLHTLVFANGAVHGRFGLTDDTAATVAGCLRAGRHRLIDEGPDGRRLFIRVVPDGKTALRG